MSLTFVLGLSGSGKTTHCLDTITNHLSQPDPPALYYIVPEQFSLQAERMLVSRSPAKAVMRAQALSFGRLAYHVFSRTGGAPVKQLNEVGKHMMLRKILKECELSFYTCAIQQPGFIENLSQTVTEFSQYNLTPQDLELRAMRLEESDISAKLTDLSEIFRRYREHITGRFLVTGETLDILADALADSDYLQDGLFWIDGFKDFTPQELRVLDRIIAKADNTTITLTMDTVPFPDSHLRPSDFFYATKHTYQILRRRAENLAVSVNAPIFLSHHRHINPQLQRLVMHFSQPLKRWDFSDSFLSTEKVSERLKEIEFCEMKHTKDPIAIVSMQDKAAEITQVAEWIKHNVIKEKRWRYRDIAVLCGDLPGYEKLARNIFEPYGIPLFIDSKMGILSHPLTELIRAVIEIAVWDWQYEGVFRLLKTGFTPLSPEKIDKLENYVLAMGIKSWRWRVQWQDQDMEGTRLQVIDMLSPFLDGRIAIGAPDGAKSASLKSDSVNTVADFARRIYYWLYALDIPGTLSHLLKESLEAKDQEQARWHRQIWPRIGEIFDKLVEILGDDPVTIQAFGDILDTGFRSADMGLIPPSLDQIVMGDITRSRYPEIKALWVLGANDGQLPPPVGGASLITEDERATLRSTGMELAPDLPRQMNDSLLALYGALCQPREALVLSYSKVGSDGKQLRPSPILARIKKILPHLVEQTPVISQNAFRPEEPKEIHPLSRESTEILYGESFYTAASRLEAYVECPFSYFLNYHLRAKERAIYQVRAMDLGILYHDVLAKATGELAQNNTWHNINYEDLEKIVNFYAEKAIQGQGQGESDHVLRSSARNMYILQRVKGICTISLWALCEQYRRGGFYTAGIEEGTKDTVLPLNLGQQMIVTGRIDRVDILEHDDSQYLKIIDYKSGNTRFSLEEVQGGTQLQLMLYMNGLLKADPHMELDKRPGGVFYFNIDDPILSIDEKPSPEAMEAMLFKQFRMSGLVLADEINITGMDSDLLNRGGESDVIPVSVKRDGSFGKNSSIADAEEFSRLCQGVEEKVIEIGRQMASGIIAPSPYRKGNKLPCRYCKYGGVCGFNRPS